MTGNRRRKQRGAEILEFTLVGIPIIFTLISLVEITRGMWVYQTMAYAVREATRYATFHGSGCESPNTCQVTVGQITTVLRAAGPGVDPNSTIVTFTLASGSETSGTMAGLLSSSTVWPPSGANATGQNVKISVKYPFRTILAMFWPGAGRPVNYSGSFYLTASSTEGIQF